MILPSSINGPVFDNGDIVSFRFDDAELSLRLPIVPKFERQIDHLCHQRDFRDVDTSRWEEIIQNRRFNLIKKNWKYEDRRTLDDVAGCFLEVDILQLNDVAEERPYTLNSEWFRQYFFDVFIEDEREFGPETRPHFPSESNNFFTKTVARPILNGFQSQTEIFDGRAYPALLAFFSLGRKFCLRVTFHLTSLHYADRENPYSEEMLHEWKLVLFDELLSHINITYTPELCALVEQYSA